MKLNAPKFVTFLVCLVLLVVGLLAALGFIPVPIVQRYSYWITFAGGALLSLACVMKGL